MGVPGPQVATQRVDPARQTPASAGAQRRQVGTPVSLHVPTTGHLPQARGAHVDGSPGAAIDLTAGSPGFAYDVAVVGLGYVGLPTALALHDAGRVVLGLDVDDARLEAIRQGRVDVLDSDRERLGVALDSDAFELTTNPVLLRNAATVVVCVPTPIDEHLLPDLSILKSACATVVAQAVPGQTVVLTSTTYVGTTRDLLVAPLQARGLVVGEDVFVAFSPERIDPGNDRHLQRDLPRVLGGVTPACTERATEVLKSTAGRIEVVS